MSFSWVSAPKTTAVDTETSASGVANDEDLHVRSVIAAAAPLRRGRRRHRRAVETLTLESRAPTALRRGKRR